jgi:hypothetical protein
MKSTGMAVLALVAMAAGTGARATSYYVDSAAPDDTGSGTQASPWKTVARVHAATLQAGDEVLFKRGGIWRETLNVRTGVTYSAYGTATDKPSIRGSVALGDLPWTQLYGSLYSANVAGLGLNTSTSRLYLDGVPLQRARHPNIGSGSYTGVANSRYAKVADHSPWTGTSFPLEAGTVAPGASVTGAEAYVRVTPWLRIKYQVNGRSGDTLNVQQDPAYSAYAAYNIQNGTAYWLENKLWMLDSPGEWVYDPATQNVYVWLPSGTSPQGQNITASVRNGITATGAANALLSFDLRNLDIRETAGDAVSISLATSFTLDSLDIHYATGRGISAVQSSNGHVQLSTIEQTDRAAIDLGGGNGASQQMFVTGNQIRHIGFGEFAAGAVISGPETKISENVIEDVSSRAVTTVRDADVRKNTIREYCREFDDCGAIYTTSKSQETGWVAGQPLDSFIVSNYISNGTGSADGTNATGRSAYGLYLDDQSASVHVVGNFVTKAAGGGLMLHDAKDITAAANVFFANPNAQIVMQDDIVNAAMTGNLLQDNVIASTDGGLFVSQRSNTSADGLAAFSGNHYLATVNRHAFFRYDATALIQRDFAQWSEVPDHDAAGTLFLMAPRPIVVSGTTPAFSEVFESGLGQWRTGDPNLGPRSVVQGSACADSTSCVALKGQTTTPDGLSQWGRFGTAAIPVQAGWIYQLEFDARADVAGASVDAMVYKDGLFSSIAPSRLTTGWQRFRRLIRTSSSVPTGAYLDLVYYGLSPNTQIYLDNVSLTEVNLQKAGGESVTVLTNTTSSTQSHACPSAQLTAPCGQYIDLSTGTAPSFPISLTPFSWRVLAWTATPWKDDDNDGVPQSDDLCSNSPRDAGVKADGCPAY